MNFDKWFNSQSVIVKAILLLIPGVNWIVECLVRISVFARKQTALHLIVLVVFVCVGWGWFLGAMDFIYMILCGHLIFAD